MNSVVRFEPSFPVFHSFSDEKDKIINWMSMGIGTREVALFMLYRIWRDSLYINTDNHAVYASFNEFVKEVTAEVDLSRSTVYSRIKDYGLFEWLDYSEEQAIRMMAARPSLYDKVLGAIFVWDQEARVPSSVKTSEFGPMLSAEFKGNVRKFIDSLESFDSIKDALDYLKSDIVGEPTIRIRVESESEIVITYETTQYNADTGESFAVYDEVEFFSEASLPDWVADAIKAKTVLK
jgi:hypothetical protein